MLPSIIEFEYDQQNSLERKSSHTNSLSFSSMSSTSKSLETLLDETIDDTMNTSTAIDDDFHRGDHALHTQLRSEPIPETTERTIGRVLPPVSESTWNFGVDELVKKGHPDFTSRSMKQIMDREYNPTQREEAFKCLRRLDEWSNTLQEEEEGELVQPIGDVNAKRTQTRRNSNSSLVRMKGTQIRRGLFRKREASFQNLPL